MIGFVHRQTICNYKIHIGGGGEGGEGEAGEGLGRHQFWCSQPKSIEGGETSPPDLGAHLWVHTERDPPFPTMVCLRVGVSGEGIKRFGRGRGELIP